MEKNQSNTPNFKNVDNQPKKRPGASDIKSALRQAFRDRLKISREGQQDKSRAAMSLSDIVQEERKEIINSIMHQEIGENVEETLRLLDEVAQELMEMQPDMTELLTEDDINEQLENSHVLCKICSDFIEPGDESINKYICSNCIATFFREEMRLTM